jgi:hypothetical protein
VAGENKVHLPQRHSGHNNYFLPHGKHTAFVTKASRLVNITLRSFSSTDVSEEPGTSIFTPLLYIQRQQVLPKRRCPFIKVREVPPQKTIMPVQSVMVPCNLTNRQFIVVKQWLLLGESHEIHNWAGIVLVKCGVLVLVISGGTGG